VNQVSSSPSRAWISLSWIASIPSLLFAALLIVASLIVRHDDGSILWEAMAGVLADAPGLARRLIVGLIATLILTRIFPRLVSWVLGAALPLALGLAVWLNYQDFGAINEQDPYRLRCNDDDTLLYLADTSPSEYERNHLGFYFYLDRNYSGRRVTCFSADLLTRHHATKLAHLAELVIEPYSPELSSEALARFADRPQIVRMNGEGRRFVFFTDQEARQATRYRIMRGGDRYYFVPEATARP
jgi:hypothetical protein